MARPWEAAGPGIRLVQLHEADMVGWEVSVQ